MSYYDDMFTDCRNKNCESQLYHNYLRTFPREKGWPFAPSSPSADGTSDAAVKFHISLGFKKIIALPHSFHATTALKTL